MFKVFPRLATFRLGFKKSYKDAEEAVSPKPPRIIEELPTVGFILLPAWVAREPLLDCSHQRSTIWEPFSTCKGGGIKVEWAHCNAAKAEETSPTLLAEVSSQPSPSLLLPL